MTRFVDDPPAGFGWKLAVTPFGSDPRSANWTPPVEPPVRPIVIVSLTLLPWLITRNVLAGVSVKSRTGGRRYVEGDVVDPRPARWCPRGPPYQLKPRMTAVGVVTDSSVLKPAPADDLGRRRRADRVAVSVVRLERDDGAVIGVSVGQTPRGPSMPTRTDTVVAGGSRTSPVVTGHE